jgi:hypothetical protein
MQESGVPCSGADNQERPAVPVAESVLFERIRGCLDGASALLEILLNDPGSYDEIQAIQAEIPQGGVALYAVLDAASELLQEASSGVGLVHMSCQPAHEDGFGSVQCLLHVVHESLSRGCETRLRTPLERVRHLIMLTFDLLAELQEVSNKRCRGARA